LREFDLRQAAEMRLGSYVRTGRARRRRRRIVFRLVDEMLESRIAATDGRRYLVLQRHGGSV
jgi:hypothetical protein